MTNQDAIAFMLEIHSEGATEEELDKLTRNLLSELRSVYTESAKLAESGATPDGAKGDPVTIGKIALEVLPTAIPSIIALVQAWTLRKEGRTVKFKGKGIEFEGSPEELHKLLEKIEGGKKKK